MPEQVVLDILAKIEKAVGDSKKESLEALDAQTAANTAQDAADKLADDAHVQAQEALVANVAKTEVVNAALEELRVYYSKV